MSSGPTIGRKGKGEGRMVKTMSIKDLYTTVRTGMGKDRLKCQNELVRRRLSPHAPE